MIKELNISNYALIESLQMDFHKGFSVITGETGAGKSILLGGMALALGKRADLKNISNPDKKCVIEVVFDHPTDELKSFIEANELDWEELIRLRREITPAGKSRAFVNDTPVSIEVLSELGGMLIDIHAQNQSLALFDQQKQMAILDGFADQLKELKVYQSLFAEYKQNAKQLEALRLKRSEAIKDEDYQNFLLEELEAAKLSEGMQEELEDRYTELSNASDILERLSQSSSIINDENYGLVEQLRTLKSLVSKLNEYGAQYEELSERIESSIIEISDLSDEFSSLEDRVEINPQRLNEVDEKLQKLYALQTKHQVQTVEELIAIKENLEKNRLEVAFSDEKIAVLEKRCVEQKDQLQTRCLTLRLNREQNIQKIEDELSKNLSLLGMPNARLKIQLEESSDFNELGLDKINFLFASNSGSAFGSLKQIASGGELSRIMLSIKVILARFVELPTLLFDEIDTGVSGEISNKMGVMMEGLAQQMQVFSITHLPQIAAKGTHHYKVIKTDDGVSAKTEIIQLSQEQRIAEIAEMLDGKNYTNSALEHAKQLLHC